MDFLTAGEAAEIASAFVGLDAANDKKKLFLYLDLAQKRAWKAGDYKGFMREASLKVRTVGERRFLITPHGYNILKGVNVNKKPKNIVESYFSFHHNSLGTLSGNTLEYVDSVVEYRESATIFPNDSLIKGQPFKVGVLSRHQDDTGAKITITGIAADGKPVSTSIDSEKSTYETETIYGARVAIEPCKMMLIDDVNWDHVSSITKGPTRGDIDVYAVFENGCVYHISSMTPFQSRSLYRIYEIPKGLCEGWDCIDALLRISEPDPIVSPSQSLIIDDKEAIISLVMSIDQTFEKKDIPAGNAFGALGLAGLNSELNSSRSPTLNPIQVIGDEVEINQEIDFSL